MNALNPPPGEDNDYLADHVEILCRCHKLWTGRDLVDSSLSRSEAARVIFTAPYAVLSHNTATDPVFNYANQTAMQLFDMDWHSITALPSRLSAEPVNQAERQRLLAEVTAKGYIDDYRGIRISRTQKRFWIENATVWNLVDSWGNPEGQAALFAQWTFI